MCLSRHSKHTAALSDSAPPASLVGLDESGHEHHGEQEVAQVIGTQLELKTVFG